MITQTRKKFYCDMQREVSSVLIALILQENFDGIGIQFIQGFNEYMNELNFNYESSLKLKNFGEMFVLIKKEVIKKLTYNININMNQEQILNYSGIITKVGDIKKSAFQDYKIIEMRSLDDQFYLKTYQIRLFGNKIRCDLKQGDLAVFKNGLIFNVSENIIFLSSLTGSHILIGENEILNDQGSDYLNKLKFMEQQFKYQSQQQQQFFYNNQHQLQNFQGIICEKGNIKVKQIDGQMQEVKGIQFMNIDQQGHFQLYKIKLVGVRAHQIVRISQKILIKNASIRKIKGQYIKLNYANEEDVTQIFVGQERVKQNCGKDEYKRFISQMDRKVDEMNKMLENLQIKKASKKIKKNF